MGLNAEPERLASGTSVGPDAERVAPDLQPDQQPARWDDHVSLYEAVFEPLTNAFAAHALDALEIRPGLRCRDVGAGSGGAALLCARPGASLFAIEASARMAQPIAARSGDARPRSVHPTVMDGNALALRPRPVRASRLMVESVTVIEEPLRAPSA